MAQNSKAKTCPKTPNPNELVECRGSTWRFLKEDSGFWQLELIKQGAVFAENPTRVWALPQLEKDSIEILSTSEALAPSPTESQKEKGVLYKPLLQARLSHSLQDSTLSKEPTTAVHCAIEQKTWQFEPWRRIVDALPFPRLLIADDVGLGKTTEAAIILTELTRRRRADRVLIIVPQHIAEKWQDELYERFGLAFEIFNRESRARLSNRGVRNPWEVVERVIVSRDFVKRWENLNPLTKVSWDMVVIDECHHFVREKNMPATRLREFAEKIAYRSPGLLLLSATPFTGSKAEFKSLLHLLDPKFQSNDVADKWDPSNPYLLRRLKGDVKKFGEIIQDRQIKTVLVSDADLSKNEAIALKKINKQIQEHHNSKNGDTWDRLLEETARKRLSSGWAAIHETISGDRKLSTWFSEDLKTSIKTLVDSHDSAKLRILAITLKSIFKEDAKSKVVIFTEAIPSQIQISDYLVNKERYPKDSVAIVRGDTARDERLAIEDAFASPNSSLRVLIATDTISEGKDLQHACNHLIHFELPWSLVKIEQRNGRIDRLGQKKRPVIHNLVFDTTATPDQKILNRLTEKLEEARTSLGSVSPIIAQLEEDLDLLDATDSKRIEAQIDSTKRDTESFGYVVSGVTPLSSAPLIAAEDYTFRQKNFQLMLKSLEGNLGEYGVTKNGDKNLEFLLSLPDGWELPGLADLGESYPSNDNPWRVTFSSKVYLEYEQYRREHGEGTKPLHFISPVHPIAIQVESRFRSRLSRQGYPVFKVTDSLHSRIIIVELTARAKSSRILAQKVTAIELKRFQEIDFDSLGEFKGVDGPISLPSGNDWEKIESLLNKAAAEYVAALSKGYGQRLGKYLVEQKGIPKTVTGVAQREAWLRDLWEVDTELPGYQILALLVGT